MADTTLAAAREALLTAILTYSDWVGTDDVANVPHSITIGTKMKGNPFADGNTAKTLPLLVAECTREAPGALYGTQQMMIFTVRLSIIRQNAVG